MRKITCMVRSRKQANKISEKYTRVSCMDMWCFAGAMFVYMYVCAYWRVAGRISWWVGGLSGGNSFSLIIH